MTVQKSTKHEAPKKKAAKKASRKPTGAKTKPVRRKRAAELVERVLKKIEEKIESAELKPTVGDYLRLLQYRDEIKTDEQPKEIKVTWVEPATVESVGEK